MDKLLLFVFIFNFSITYGTVDIVELKGPESIEYGSTEEIILDCNFKADGEKDLVIKWFYNGDTHIIYQWIPESNTSGYAMGILKDRVDLAYAVTNDSNTKYRALKIFNVTMDLTGNYTCKVSSFDGEDSETKQVVIYNPAKDGLHISLSEENNTITCDVQGVFPEPEINLYISGENDTKISIEDILLNSTTQWEKDESGYSITKIYILNNLTDLTMDANFVCDMVLPGTDYSLTASQIYETPNLALVNSPEWHWSLIVTMMSILFKQIV